MALNRDGWRLDHPAIIYLLYPPISATFRRPTHRATPATTPPKTGSASLASRSSVAVSWTSTCSITSPTLITLSPSVSGTHNAIHASLPLFHSSTVSSSVPPLSESVISPSGVSLATLIWMLNSFPNFVLFIN